MAYSTSGEGPYSYAQYSSYQKKGIESVMTIICKEVSESLDVKELLSSSARLSIADLGCSVGPNTFYVVDSILEAVELKFRSEGLNPEGLETQVFFNDQDSNDFNALFRSVPSNRKYYAVGLPGSFYDRLFPKASIHFMHSSYALQWLSKVPEEVTDEDSTAWNKGRVVYGSREVEAAYSAQYLKDMGSFLAARAEELVRGGILALLVPGAPDGADPLKCMPIGALHLLGLALMDMVKMGLVDEAKVDSFNFPIYCPPLRELEAAVQRNGNFTIIRLDEVVQPKPPLNKAATQMAVSSIRSIVEKPLSECFGDGIMDELFDRFAQKILEVRMADDASYHSPVNLLAVLKRK